MSDLIHVLIGICSGFIVGHGINTHDVLCITFGLIVLIANIVQVHLGGGQ